MSVESVKPFGRESGMPAVAPRQQPETGEFAAVARSVAEGNIEAARAALAASPAALSRDATLAGALADGNLAAARLALSRLGAATVPPAGTVASAKPAAAPPAFAHGDQTRYVPPATAGGGKVAPPPSSKLAQAVGLPPVAATPASVGLAPGLVVADVGATLARPTIDPPPGTGATATSSNGTSYKVSDILVALATGNAGSIPADLINRYGPGGALYDPAAIMDAYRSSALGQAQMAQASWIGRPV
jgi:hypothetical protein